MTLLGSLGEPVCGVTFRDGWEHVGRNAMEDIVGGIAILTGILLYFLKNKRKFDRTNTAGIEQFKSYSGKLSARMGDIALWFAAMFCTLFGTFLIAQEHMDTWGWIVYALFFGWLLVGVFFMDSGDKRK